MMLHLIALVTPWDPLHNDGYQFWSGIGSGSPIIAAVLLALRHRNCDHHRCLSIRTWPHGHMKLCKKHHPHVPDHGKVTQEHIDAETARQAVVAQDDPKANALLSAQRFAQAQRTMRDNAEAKRKVGQR